MKKYMIRYFSQIIQVRACGDLNLLDKYKDFWCLRWVMHDETYLPELIIDRKGSSGLEDRVSLPRRRIGMMDIVHMRDVCLVSSGLIFTHEGATERRAREALIGHVINESDIFYNNPIRVEHISKQLKVEFSPPARVKAELPCGEEIHHDMPVFQGYTPRDRAYSHFIYETVARVAGFKKIRSEVPGLKFAVRKDIPGWGRDILANYGVAENELLYVDTERANVFSRLFVIRGTGVNNFWARPDTMNFLAEARRSDTPWRPQGRSRGRRIIISRKGSRGSIRRLINQDELWSIAEKEFGYETVAAEALDFAAKRDLFSSAEFLIGEYGGGLQTHFLCRPNTKILCLMSDMFERDFIDRTAAMLSLESKSLIGPAIPKFRDDPNNSNFYIDPAVFREALSQQEQSDR